MLPATQNGNKNKQINDKFKVLTNIFAQCNSMKYAILAIKIMLNFLKKL